MIIQAQSEITLTIDIEADVTPGYPPFRTSNHDSPVFSDSGSPDEVRIITLYIGKSCVYSSDLSEEQLEVLKEAVLEQMRQDLI